MKQVLLICLFITSTFALNFKEEVDKVLSNPNDSVFGFHISTLWRGHIDYETYNINRGKAESDMVWILNTTTGTGVMHDNTPNITSIYEVLEFSIKFITIHDGTNQLLINALIKSDVGNYYSVIVNDAYQQLIFSGPASNACVIREYDIESTFLGTAKELKTKLNSI